MRDKPMLLDIPEVPTLRRLVHDAGMLARVLARDSDEIIGIERPRAVPPPVVLSMPIQRSERALEARRAKKRAAKAMRQRRGRAHDRAGRPL